VTPRPTPLPPPLHRRGKEGGRDELALDPEDASHVEEPDSEVFERATAVPESPERESTGLELDFSSLPPARRPPASNPFDLGSIPPLLGDSDPARAPSERGTAPVRGGGREDAIPTLNPNRDAERLSLPDVAFDGDPGDRSDRKRTVPEPLVERHIARVESGPPRGAGERRRPVLDPPDPFDDEASPLGLVEAYRHSTDSMPRVEAPARPSSVASESPASSVPSDMQDRYAVGDFTGALVVAESILDTNPDDEDAKRYAQSCREVLTQMYAARIGPMDQVAMVAVPPDQITWLSLDHRAGFLLSLVDGVSSIEEILDISGMTRLDALRIMYTLVQQNVITLSH
jgi:hypothetical protein